MIKKLLKSVFVVFVAAGVFCLCKYALEKDPA